MRLDLNMVRVEEIVQVAGIDRTVAQRLCDHRDHHGGLMSWSEIERLVGSDRAVIDRLKDHFNLESMDRPEAST